jgi:hypothetical protein
MSLSCAAPAVRALSSRCNRRCEYARLNSAAALGVGDATTAFALAPMANENDDAGAGNAAAGEADTDDAVASAEGKDDHSSCMHDASQPTSR